MTPDIFIKVSIFLVAVCFLGFLVDRAIAYVSGKAEEYRLTLNKLPLFFILGGGSYTFYETAFSILGIKSNTVHFVSLIVIFLLVNVIAHLKGAKSRGKEAPPCLNAKKNAYAALVIALIILAPLLINLITAMAFPQFDIDVISHILMKAKILTTDTYKSSVFLHDELFANAHSRYPPFVGIFFNALFLLGCNTLSVYQIANYFIFLLLGLSVYSYLKDKIPLWQGIAWFFIFMSTRGYISSQFIMDSTDILLSLSFLLAVFFLLKSLEEQSIYNFLMCAVLLGLSTLIKNEALFFNMFVIPILLWLYRRNRGLYKYLSVWLLIILPWFLYRYTLPNPFTSAENIFKAADIKHSLEHTGEALGMITSVLSRDWNAAFILWPAATAILLKGKFAKAGALCAAVAAILVMAYILIMWLDVGKVINYRNGFFRILSHAYPITVITIALAVAGILERKTNI